MFRKLWATNASLLVVIKCSTPGIQQAQGKSILRRILLCGYRKRLPVDFSWASVRRSSKTFQHAHSIGAAAWCESRTSPMQIITHHYAPLRSCVNSCWKVTITQNLSTFALNYASLRSHSGGGVGPPLPSRMRNEFGCVKVRKNCVNNGFLRKLRKLRKRVNLEFLRNLCIFA